MGKLCSYQKCAKCGGKFEREHISETFTDLKCPLCGIRPTRIFIDIGRPGMRYISKDEHGNYLSLDTANALLAEIKLHIDRPGFDPTKYIARNGAIMRLF